MRFRWIALCGFAIAILQAQVAEAATFNVNWPVDEIKPDGHCTLREAVAAANNNTMSDDCQFQTGSAVEEDRIFVNAGTYTLKACPAGQTANCGPLKISGALEMSSGTRKSAGGKNDVIIDGANVDRAIEANADFKLYWITISNTKNSAVYANAFIEIRDCNLTNNGFLSNDGSAVEIVGPNGGAAIERTNISGNHHGLYVRSPVGVWLDNSTIDNNSTNAVTVGPGGWFQCLMSTISGNGRGANSYYSGGGIHNSGGIVHAYYCTIVDNIVNLYNEQPNGSGVNTMNISESIVADPADSAANCLTTGASSAIDLNSRSLIDGDPLVGYPAGYLCTLRRDPAHEMVVTSTAKLGPLAFAGGPTRVHVPLADSRAIDNGSADVIGCPNDQRGVGDGQRGQLVPCDLGSVEATVTFFSAPLVSIVANPMNAMDCGPASSGRGFAVTNLNTTPGIQCPGCVGGQYEPTDSPTSPAWADVLRLAFFGIHHDASETRDCDSDARRSLVANYTNIFEQTCSGGACAGQPLRHLWRRSEAADATIADLLGTDVKKFCNAGNASPPTAAGSTDYLDNDPIRVPCAGTGRGVGDQVCGTVLPSGDTSHAGNLGLLLPILPPSETDVPSADLYPTPFCTAGENELLEATKTTFSGYCPAGNPSFGGKCFTSVIRTPGGFSANCIQYFATGACPFMTPAGTDCRGASLWMRRPDGTIVADHSLPTSRKVAGAFFRIHSSRSMVAGAPPCTERAVDSQVACLVNVADVCTAGLADTSN